MSAVLSYQPAADDHEAVHVEAQGTHRIFASCKDELITAIHQLKAPRGAELVLLGRMVTELPRTERAALRARVSFVPASGGLLSNLNGWENISLPVGYHDPSRLPSVPAEVYALVDELGGCEGDMLAKLPEHMSLYEKRLAAYIRALLERPELMVTENLAAGLGPTKRRRAQRFAEIYHARCPGGTYVQLDDSSG
jgi:ABC-type transporter Mla maintaining outer membrane lipid asymmetry ATPase subunit MlaF